MSHFVTCFSVLCLSLMLIVSPVQASEGQAKAFIGELAEKAIAVIADETLDQDQKAKRFGKLLDKDFDVETIGRFSIGRHWKSASAEQRDEYIALFKKMIVKIYTGRFQDYTNEKVEVLKATKVNKRDMVVSSQVVFEGNRPPIKLDWRVRKNKSGQFRVIDLVVEGVSMSVTQRSEFSSIIQSANGDVSVLIKKLRKKYAD